MFVCRATVDPLRAQLGPRHPAAPFLRGEKRRILAGKENWVRCVSGVQRWELHDLAFRSEMGVEGGSERDGQGSTGGSFGGALDIANRGQIRFYRRGVRRCAVKLTISYECPDVLVPLAGAVTPLVEGILKTDMQRFATLAASAAASAPQPLT